ncbi:MAG: ATP-binding protein [Bacilli bacterium]|nr:ATP-binding protein [Bacilli bacterium]
MYITRKLEKIVVRLSEEFPVVCVIGVRQCGKSTMLRHILPKGFHEASVDTLSETSLAEEDPRGYLLNHGLPLFIDEAQNAPALFPEILHIIEERKAKGESVYGLFWLSGSNKTELLKRTQESMAGRVAFLEMSTLSKEEIEGRDEEVFDPLFKDVTKRNGPALGPHELYQKIFRGGYPELYDHPEKNPDDFYASYIDTYIKKDVSGLIAEKSAVPFNDFIAYCAGFVGQQFVVANASTALGVNVKTIVSWLSILENTGILYFLKPYSNVVSRRLVKAPKLYFMDTGLAAYLSRWLSAEQLEIGAMSGHYLENYVVSEIVKSHHNTHTRLDCLFYYRDFDQKEFDLLFADNERLFPLEIKNSANPKIPSSDPLTKFSLSETARLILCSRDDKFIASSGGWSLLPFSIL